MVLDAEVVRQCRRVARGIDLDDRHVMLDVSARTGPGGHFLGAKETRVFLREGEHQLPTAFVRGAYDTWRASGVPEVERATKMVDEILATHEVAPLPDGGEARMRAAVEAATDALGEALKKPPGRAAGTCLPPPARLSDHAGQRRDDDAADGHGRGERQSPAEALLEEDHARR